MNRISEENEFSVYPCYLMIVKNDGELIFLTKINNTTVHTFELSTLHEDYKMYTIPFYVDLNHYLILDNDKIYMNDKLNELEYFEIDNYDDDRVEGEA